MCLEKEFDPSNSSGRNAVICSEYDPNNFKTTKE